MSSLINPLSQIFFPQQFCAVSERHVKQSRPLFTNESENFSGKKSIKNNQDSRKRELRCFCVRFRCLGGGEGGGEGGIDGKKNWFINNGLGPALGDERCLKRWSKIKIRFFFIDQSRTYSEMWAVTFTSVFGLKKNSMFLCLVRLH